MIIRSRTPVRVLTVLEETQRVHKSGHGPEAKFEELPTGYWRAVCSDLTTLKFSEKPELVQGDEVYILVEKRDEQHQP